MKESSKKTGRSIHTFPTTRKNRTTRYKWRRARGKGTTGGMQARPLTPQNAFMCFGPDIVWHEGIRTGGKDTGSEPAQQMVHDTRPRQNHAQLSCRDGLQSGAHLRAATPP